jgi:hypothetical protein
MTTDIELTEKGFTKTAWIVPDEKPSFEQWAEMGATLQQIDASLPWWIGDWLNFGEWAWGEDYAQAIEATGMEVSRLNNYKWIAGKIDRENRRECLSWSHHRAVAALPDNEQTKWLNYAETNGCSVNDLMREINREKMSVLPSPDVNDNGNSEPDEKYEPEPEMVKVSPVRRLRYGMKMLIERHMKVAPYDIDHPIVIQAQNIFSETKHAENEDLSDE